VWGRGGGGEGGGGGVVEETEKTLGVFCLKILREPKFAACKGKAVPLQAWTGPEGSRKLRFPDFRDNDTGWW